MPLLNYTTKVDVYTTLGAIQGQLVKHGAKKIMQDNARLESELEHVAQFRQNYEIYKAIQDVMHKHGIWIFRASDAAKELDKALSRKCPEDISSVRQSLEIALNRLKRMEEAGEKAGDGKEPQT